MSATIPSLVRLYLIRHGQTAWSHSGRHTGHPDLPLTEHGKEEARELGRHIRQIPFAQVLTSPLKRARQTCELVGLDHLAEIEPDLAEWDYGDYEGQRSEDIHQERPDWNLFRDGAPHGEMPEQLADRADRLIARLGKLEGNIALFSHAQFGSVLAVRWIGLRVTAGQHFQLATASLSMLTFASHYPALPVIALWNADFQKQPLAKKHASKNSSR